MEQRIATLSAREINDSKCPCAMTTPLAGIIASQHVDGHVKRGHMDPCVITDFLGKQKINLSKTSLWNQKI